MKNLKLTFMACMALAFGLTYAGPARADAGQGFGSVFNVFFGDQADRDAQATCQDPDGASGAGILGIVNNFFCHMEKDMGITGATAGVTKTFGSMSVHAVVTVSAATVNGVSYDNQAQVWVCNSNCTSAANFSPAINIYWSYKSDKTINKGDMLMDPCAFGGTAGCAMHLTYDVGSNTSNQYVNAKIAMTQNGSSAFLDLNGTKSNGVLAVAGVLTTDGTQANSFRFAAEVDTNANTGGVYFESGASSVGTGSAATQMAASGDSETSNSMCFVRTPSGNDWNYAATGQTGCTVPNMPSDSVNTVAAYTGTGGSGILYFTGNASAWGGMSTNPSSI